MLERILATIVAVTGALPEIVADAHG